MHPVAKRVFQLQTNCHPGKHDTCYATPVGALGMRCLLVTGLLAVHCAVTDAMSTDICTVLDKRFNLDLHSDASTHQEGAT